jgi:hypothetical protein
MLRVNNKLGGLGRKGNAVVNVLHPETLGTYTEPRFLKWSQLAIVAQSAVLRRYFVFVFTVPILAFLIEKSWFLTLRLPLTLTFAYVAGLFFFVGAFLVSIWCPEINRPGRTYTAIEAEGRTSQYVLQEVRETYLGLANDSRQRANHFLALLLGSEEFVTNPAEFGDILTRLKEQPDLELTRTALWQSVQSANWATSALREGFWTVQWFSDGTYSFRRRLCFSFFLAGAVFAVGVIVVQLFTVWRAA